MKGKDELEGTRSNFEHQGENCWGLLQPPLGELGLTDHSCQI